MRICLISSEHGRGGLGISVGRLARLLAREHEVTVVHAYERRVPPSRDDDPPTLRHLVVDPSRLPRIAFSCDDHARSAAVLAAIEQAYGDEPPDYLEFADYRGHALVPLQARAGGHRSLRGATIAVRLRGMAELVCLHDGTWPRPRHRMVFDLEREALRLADLVIHPSRPLLDLYRAAIEGVDFSSAVRIRLPFEPGEEPAPRQAVAGEPLRILYAGRLQKVKGVLPLVEACLEASRPDWRLTLIGADTETAPLNQSVQATIETLLAGDQRVEILDPVSHEELQRRFAEHDLLAAPSLFECWSNVALEAMRAGLPVLATPVGGLAEIVSPGVTGWHTEGTGREPIRRELERLLEDRGEVERVRVSGAPRARFLELTDESAVLSAYRELLAGLPRPRVPSGGDRRPLVTGIVTYFGEHEHVREAVSSLFAQTHERLEVLVVDDGSFEPEDAVLAELAEEGRVRVLYKPNGGEASARNLAVSEAEGDYVVFLDADNTLEPDFVARALAVLEADPELAYVTPWLRFVAEDEAELEKIGARGFAALGNAVRHDDAINSDGDTLALMPRRLFAREGYRYEEGAALMADWELYRRLREDGRYGMVIPALLGNYRLRGASLSRQMVGPLHSQAWDEALSRRRLRARKGAVA